MTTVLTGKNDLTTTQSFAFILINRATKINYWAPHYNAISKFWQISDCIRNKYDSPTLDERSALNVTCLLNVNQLINKNNSQKLSLQCHMGTMSMPALRTALWLENKFCDISYYYTALYLEVV